MSTVYYSGAYEPSRGYSPGALVQFGGSTYICTRPVGAAHRFAFDDFVGRRMQSGWGRASDGHSLWALGTGCDPSRLVNFSVQNGLALVTYNGSGNLTGSGSNFYLTFGATQSSVERDLLVRFRYSKPVSGYLSEWVLHSTPAWETAAPDVEFDVNKTYIWLYGGGSDSANAVRESNLVEGTWYDSRLRAAPPLFAARTWPTGTPEPETWDVSVSDSFTMTPGLVICSPRWTGMPANLVIQHSYVAQLSVNPSPADDSSHFDQIA